MPGMALSARFTEINNIDKTVLIPFTFWRKEIDGREEN